MRRLIMMGLKLLPLMQGIKGWVFSDGKFNKARTKQLIIIMCIIIGGVYAIGVDNMNDVIDMLDEVSDTIGYSEV